MSYRLLLDTSSLMYRAFFALPQSIVDADGAPINAVHGYLDMTTRLLNIYSPDELIHVYDADWRPSARVSIYPGYKAGRADDPPALPSQFLILREVLSALGMTQAESPGWEADDAIGSLCDQAVSGDSIGIVTGDRDLFQLVQGATDSKAAIHVYYTVRGVSKLDVYDSAAVETRYGVIPERYVDFAILRGDPSDGLPGVKGIGEKTATRLIHSFGSLEDLLDSATDLTPRLAETLREAHAYIAAMQQIVPVRRDVAVQVERPARNEEQLNMLAKRYNLGGPIRRMGELL